MRAEDLKIAFVGMTALQRKAILNRVGEGIEQLAFYDRIEEVDIPGSRVVYEVQNSEKRIIITFCPTKERVENFSLSEWKIVFTFPTKEEMLKVIGFEKYFSEESDGGDGVGVLLYFDWLLLRLEDNRRMFWKRGWKIDYENMTILRSLGSGDAGIRKTETLTSMELRIMAVMETQPGSTIKKASLVSIFYGPKKRGYDNLKPILTSLRKKLRKVKMDLISNTDHVSLVCQPIANS